MGKDNRYPREVFNQLSVNGLLRSTDVPPSGVAVPHADCPGSRRIYRPSGEGIGEQVSDETTGTGDHPREAEEDTGGMFQY